MVNETFYGDGQMIFSAMSQLHQRKQNRAVSIVVTMIGQRKAKVNVSMISALTGVESLLFPRAILPINQISQLKRKIKTIYCQLQL